MKIIQNPIEKILPIEYVKYATYVARFRALPDVRDMLKDGQRKILYSQFLEGMTPDKNYKKATATVTCAMNFSVHGDQGIYKTAIRMSQPFALRYPLVDCGGNNGSQSEPGSFAAMRYVDMRLSEAGYDMLNGLKQGAIEESKWEENYLQTSKFPKVLPSIFPNICNGSSGIGVGMSCSVPQFNVVDVCNAIRNLINNPKSEFEDLYCPIDFCTGGKIANESEVKESLKNGKGKSATLYVDIIYDSQENALIVESLPYQVSVETIKSEIEQGIDSEKLNFIKDFADACGADGVKLFFYLAPGTDVRYAIQELYKNTSLMTHYSINMTMLKNGVKPVEFGWKDILNEYLLHQREININRLSWQKSQLEYEKMILEGIMKAIQNIEKVIHIIREEINPFETLKTFLSINDKQAEAILSMQLKRLTKLQVDQLQEKLQTLNSKIKKLEHLLKNIDEVIKQNLDLIVEKFGDERRTINQDITLIEDRIESENNIIEYDLISYTDGNYILIRRGSKINGRRKYTRIPVTNECIITSVSNLGRQYSKFINRKNEAREFNPSFGFNLSKGEKIISSRIIRRKYDDNFTKNGIPSIIILTKNGEVKRIDLTKIKQTNRKNGIQLVSVKPKDEIVDIKVYCNESFMIKTKDGFYLKLPISAITSTQPGSGTVKAIRLGKNDQATELIDTSNEIFKDFVIGNKNTKGKKV